LLLTVEVAELRGYFTRLNSEISARPAKREVQWGLVIDGVTKKFTSSLRIPAASTYS